MLAYCGKCGRTKSMEWAAFDALETTVCVPSCTQTKAYPISAAVKSLLYADDLVTETQVAQIPITNGAAFARAAAETIDLLMRKSLTSPKQKAAEALTLYAKGFRLKMLEGESLTGWADRVSQNQPNDTLAFWTMMKAVIAAVDQWWLDAPPTMPSGTAITSQLSSPKTFIPQWTPAPAPPTDPTAPLLNPKPNGFAGASSLPYDSDFD